MRISDWSSDVCSSDLLFLRGGKAGKKATQRNAQLRSRSGVAACYVGPGFVTKIGIFCTDIFLASLNRFVDLRRRHPVLQAGTFQDIIPEGSRSEEHTSELQSLMRISYAVFCLTK